MTFLGTPAATWFPVFTLILGAVLKGVFDALSDRRTSRRELAARVDQRKDARHVRRTEFQRTTLLELQDAILRLGRMLGAAHYQTVISTREGHTWGKAQLTDEVNTGYTDALNVTSKLRARTADAEARGLIQLFQNECTSVVFAGSEAAAVAGMRRLAKVQDDLHDRVGVLLRALDEDQ
jgi:hypothetical protein